MLVALFIFTDCFIVQTGTESSESENSIFDAVENLESSLLMLTAPLNQFEEWMQWTIEGKLWMFPIDNEQGENRQNSGFHFIFVVFFLSMFCTT